MEHDVMMIVWGLSPMLALFAVMFVAMIVKGEW